MTRSATLRTELALLIAQRDGLSSTIVAKRAELKLTAAAEKKAAREAEQRQRRRLRQETARDQSKRLRAIMAKRERAGRPKPVARVKVKPSRFYGNGQPRAGR